MILHTVNKSPLSHRVLGTCLRFMGPDDALVLIEDGVYAALGGVDCGLERAPGAVYVLGPDAAARGLSERLASHVVVVDYEAFVDLCASFNAVKQWS